MEDITMDGLRAAAALAYAPEATSHLYPSQRWQGLLSA